MKESTEQHGWCFSASRFAHILPKMEWAKDYETLEDEETTTRVYLRKIRDNIKEGMKAERELMDRIKKLKSYKRMILSAVRRKSKRKADEDNSEDVELQSIPEEPPAEPPAATQIVADEQDDPVEVIEVEEEKPASRDTEDEESIEEAPVRMGKIAPIHRVSMANPLLVKSLLKRSDGTTEELPLPRKSAPTFIDVVATIKKQKESRHPRRLDFVTVRKKEEGATTTTTGKKRKIVVEDDEEGDEVADEYWQQ